MADESEKASGYIKVNRIETPKVLSPEVLNNEIVNFRPLVQKSRIFLIQHLVRKIRQIKKRIEKKPNQRLLKKFTRFEDEIVAIKNIKRDDVAKFALLNKKNLSQLGIQGNTPAVERSLYKLACEPPIVNEVLKFRKTYPNWEINTAYFLQRLGLQYAGRKSIKYDDTVLDMVENKITIEKCGIESELWKKEESKDLEEEFIRNTEPHVTEEKKRSGVKAVDPNTRNCEEFNGKKQKPYSKEVSRYTNSDEWDMSDMDVGCDSEDDIGHVNSRRNLFGFADITKDQLSNKPTPSSTMNGQDKRIMHSILKSTLQSNEEITRIKRRKQVKESNFVNDPEIKPSVSIVRSKQAVVKHIKLEEGGEIIINKYNDYEKGDVKDDSDLSKCELSTSFFVRDLPQIRTNNCATKSFGRKSDDNSDMPLVLVPRKDIVSRSNITGCKEKITTGSVSGLSQSVDGEITKQVCVAKEMKLGRRSERKGRLEEKFENVGDRLSTGLHPSWAARRIQKERQSAPSQGKKKVFTDDE